MVQRGRCWDVGAGAWAHSQSRGRRDSADLLSDEEVKLHAIDAWEKMKSKRALFQLEPLLKDKRASVRKEARKAITKVMR